MRQALRHAREVQKNQRTESCRTISRDEPASTQPPSGNSAIVKWDNVVGEDLVGMAALSGDQHSIAASGVGQSGFDCGPAVGFNTDLSGLVKAGQEVARGSGSGLRCGGC